MRHSGAWDRIADLAKEAGLSRDICRAIRWGRCPVDAVDASVGIGEVDAETWAPIRERVVAEQKRVKAMEAACSRAYRARKAEARREADKRTCLACGKPIKGKRADAKFCSTGCRVWGNRRRGQLRWLAFNPDHPLART